MFTVNANGADIPAIGFGTWTLTGDQCAFLVSQAIKTGYRHLDTAAFYDNEEAVGAGIANSGIDRQELFVTTKVWHTDIGEGALQRSLEASLKRLGLDQVDLVLIHWPSKTIPMAESTKALNNAREQGLARNIGVSNYTNAMIEELVKLSKNPICCNQVEYHPFLDQGRMLETCQKHGIARTAYCPLARGGELFAEPVIVEAAKQHGKTPAQIVLRWHIQQPDSIAIPRTTSPARLAENLSILDFKLSREQMKAITTLCQRGTRICDFEFSPQWD